MQIKRAIDKIPGGMMLVPLFLGALCHTFAPGAGSYFGSFTNGLITGTVPILAIWFFCMGASIKLSATGTVLRKSGTLVVTKIAVAWLVAAIASRLLPANGVEVGFFAGLSTLALVASMDMTNGGLYASIMQQYGSKEEAGAFVLMSLESGPLMTMVIIGTAGIASFEPQVFVGAVLPFIIGFVLGNLDSALREFFSSAVQTLIPFFAFALGNTINLAVIAHTGLLGILLGLLVIVITGIPLILADRLIGGGDGTAGIAASSTAGAAVATPAIIAGMAPQFAPMAPAATALVATSVIVTSILVPVITALYSRRVKRGLPATAGDNQGMNGGAAGADRMVP
ncbi:2-keto-3-deoxygluconate transporter [Sodalis praecaptivus]|uniref:2-keto-3-deoxygluconate permease n=1 Tax=Sodalis praecaptivus TaxID=1239307 RepID=W0HT00_9GAMM|nr:2-keto-3-deoxygluconate transporter [Sodalis praecaptivus]AHF76931.1 2-keto-3-deoxygluconate transporter [Sodalis praecaptivus]